MKTSSSTSSLDALNTNDPTCFICIEIANDLGEPLVDGKMLRKCGCAFHVHPACWNTWLASGRSEFDCPICRKGILHLSIPVEDAPPLTRVRAQSFPYADESFVCCLPVPSKIATSIFFGVISIFVIWISIKLSVS